MFPALALRILRTTDPRLLGKFMWNFGVKGLLSVERFKHRIKRGEYFPPFLYLSILNSCNLRCKTCGQWGETGYNHEKADEEIREIVPYETYRRMVDEIAHLKPFYYIWGGEPYLYPDIIPLMEHMKKRGGAVEALALAGLPCAELRELGA